MEENIEKLQFPIGKYKPNLEFDFSRTLKDMDTLGSFAEMLKESIKDLDESDFKKTYRKGGMNIAQIIHHWCDTHTYAFLRTKHTILEDNPNVKMYEVDEFLSTPILLHEHVGMYAWHVRHHMAHIEIAKKASF